MKFKLMKLLHVSIAISIVFLFFSSVQIRADTCSSLYQVTATQLNVRDKPSSIGSVIGSFHKDNKVCIQDMDGNWGKTNIGWISTNHIVPVNNAYVADVSSATSSSDSSGLIAVIIFIIVISVIFFALKTFFYHMLINLGMAEPDGRSKSGIRLTRLGKFMRGLSGLLLFLLFLLIGSLSK